jgi:hypothetical protein
MLPCMHCMVMGVSSSFDSLYLHKDGLVALVRLAWCVHMQIEHLQMYSNT